ncbi:hypothetical protein DYB32_004747, partial [Aphanomyces invadans]
MVQLADVEGHARVLAAQLDNETHRNQVVQRQNAALKARIRTLQQQVETLNKAEADVRLDRDELQLQYEAVKLQVQLLQDPTNEVLVAALTAATKSTWANPQAALGFLDNPSMPQADTPVPGTGHHYHTTLAKSQWTRQLLRDTEHKAAVLKALNDDLVQELERMRAQH